jgi:hypothetical protein
MKVKLVKDSKGNVVAAVEHGAANETKIEPVIPKDYTIEEVEVSHDYKSDIKGFFEKYRSK